MDYILTTNELTKQYGSYKASNEVSIHLPRLRQPLFLSLSIRDQRFLPWHFLYFLPDPQGQGSLG